MAYWSAGHAETGWADWVAYIVLEIAESDLVEPRWGLEGSISQSDAPTHRRNQRAGGPTEHQSRPPGRHPGDQALLRLDGHLPGSPKGIKTISYLPAGSFPDPNWQTLNASGAEQNPETGHRIETVE